jgi:hypothetical protein
MSRLLKPEILRVRSAKAKGWGSLSTKIKGAQYNYNSIKETQEN